jgi:catechol 2,3-dioxygenase-like lactoylglutathione lyase family enzyme
MSEQTTTRITGIRNVAVPVSDHDRALQFYCGTLGMETRLDATFGPGLRWAEVAPPGAVTTVALAPRNDGQSGGVDTGIRLATADVEATHEYLASQGVDVDDILRLPGVPLMFSLRDADGNSLYMVEAGPA